MDSHESECCQFLFSCDHGFPHKIGSGFVHKSDVVSLRLGHDDLDRIHKRNAAFCFDCNKRSFAYMMTLCTILIGDALFGLR